MKSVIVIGGGAAGLMAAGTAAKEGHRVTLIEKNKILGRKVLITGKGRCNVTNNCEINEFIESVPVNGRFLYSAINAFTPKDTMNFFENLGVPLKTERGNRVFPVSDRSADIVNALKKYNKGVNIIKGKVVKINCEDNIITGVTAKTENGHLSFDADAVIIATGGLSYPTTGSTGDGYRFAKELGHTIIPPKPSLVPIETKEEWPKRLSGLTLKNVAIKVFDKNKKLVYSDFGEMLFTHFGVSGPIILSLSSHLRDIKGKNYTMSIDLKPALDEGKLDARLLRDFNELKNKSLKNAMSKLLPSSMVLEFINLLSADPDMKVNMITKELRKKIIYLLKNLDLTLSDLRPIEEAVITSGGVSVKEINPKTMESKLVSNLYFAGEVIDVDAYTGGFNLQIAFSTGYLAAKNI